MNYEDIKKLIDDMGNSKLTEISIDFPDGTKIGMKKEVKVVEKVQEKNRLIFSPERNLTGPSVILWEKWNKNVLRRSKWNWQ